MSSGVSSQSISCSLPERRCCQLQCHGEVAFHIVAGEQQLVAFVDGEIGEAFGINPALLELESDAVRSRTHDLTTLVADAGVTDEGDHEIGRASWRERE